MILDNALMLAICIPTLLLISGPLRACAAAMMASFVMIIGYEWLTGGYAVYGVYILADLACASWLTLALLHYQPYRPAILVAVGYWLCCMIHGLKLMGVAPDVLTYWWILRIINACQLLIIGGAGVGGGKRGRWLGDFLRFHRRSLLPASFRVRDRG